MFDQIAGWLLATLDSVPIMLGATPHNAHLVRAVVALFVIALLVYFMAMRPFRGLIGGLFGRSKDKQR